MGLYFSGLDFFATTSCEGLGLPTRSRAISRTVLLAVKVLFFLFLPALVLPAMRASSHRNSQKCNNHKRSEGCSRSVAVTCDPAPKTRDLRPET